MRKVAVVKKGEVDFDTLYRLLRDSPEIDKCGAVVSFTGIVRGYDVYGNRLTKLIYDADEKIAVERMEKIRSDLLQKYPQVKEILIYHIIDELGVGEETVYILVAAEHRKEAFEAAKECIDRIKAEVPIWKKEEGEASKHWIVGDEVVESEY